MDLHDADSAFIGLDMNRDPALLKQGFYSVGEHVECENGTVASRSGHLCVPWGDDWKYTRTYEKRPIKTHGNIIDAILFRNPTTRQENVVFATADGGFLLKPGTNSESISWPDGYSPTVNGTLIQAFDKVYFMDDTNTVVWSGDPAEDFEYVATPDGYTSLGAINTSIGEYHKNRLFIATDENTVWASDILEPTAYSINNEFFVNQGDADEIVRLKGYTSDRLLVFKSNSIYSLDRLTGDLSGAEINLIAAETGLSAKRCLSIISQDVYWLSRRGIMKAALAYDQRLTPDTVPLSEPIQPIIDRINWSYASGSWSAVVQERIYFSVPIDDSATNNCVMVYNLKNRAWESVDIYDDFTEEREFFGGDFYTDNFGPQCMVRMEYAGRDVLISFTKLGCSFLYRYNAGKKDVSIEPYDTLANFEGDADSPIGTDSTGYDPFIINFQDRGDKIETRGYLAGDLSTKRGIRFDFTTSTYNPDFDIECINGGPNEVTTLKTGITREPTVRLDYTNSGTTTAPTDHTESYLEDYSIDAYSTLWGETGPTFINFYFGDDSNADVYIPLEQTFAERFRINKRTRAPRLRITNRDGVFRLKSVIAKEQSRAHKNRREV